MKLIFSWRSNRSQICEPFTVPFCLILRVTSLRTTPSKDGLVDIEPFTVSGWSDLDGDVIEHQPLASVGPADGSGVTVSGLREGGREGGPVTHSVPPPAPVIHCTVPRSVGVVVAVPGAEGEAVVVVAPSIIPQVAGEAVHQQAEHVGLVFNPKGKEN